MSKGAGVNADGGEGEGTTVRQSLLPREKLFQSSQEVQQPFPHESVPSLELVQCGN